MTILTLRDVSLAYGHLPLLDRVNLQISTGERICLVGRNGTGKSTLFRVLSGTTQADDGEIWRKDTLRISHLEQEVLVDTPATVFEVVAAGLGELGQLLTDYHNAVHHVGQGDATSLKTLSTLQQRIDVLDGWNVNHRVETVLSRLSLPADKHVADCSGGIRRQVMLAQALVSNPDLLLLDEPTNHMDIAAITWLEEFLLSYQGALIFITHDRTLVKHLASRIIDLDRGKLTSFPVSYDYYLKKKEEALELEARTNAKFDRKLAEEEAWIRQGIKARRTRNEGRARALQAMRSARRQRIEVQSRARIDVDSSDLSGKLVADLRHVDFRYGDHWIIRDLSTRILRGDRVGIIGPNGSGKSTLLRLIVGELKPLSGQVVMGARLELAYFDQKRAQLNLEKTVRDNIGEGKDYINVRGRPRHVIGYLKEFLFPPERIDSPVKSLSGGERNRLLLAKLLAQPANVMVLDEPTNDLDVDTLELLENLLADYEGTLLLVSHDRTFLDNVVTSTLVFEGEGRVGEYVGGYEDWIKQRGAPAMASPRDKVAHAAKEPNRNKRNSVTKRKLSYKEQRELESFPERIEALEQERQELEEQIHRSEFYRQEKEVITRALARLDRLCQELDEAYARWGQLDAKTR